MIVPARSLTILASFLVVFAFTACGPRSAEVPASDRQPAPDFILPAVAGGEVSREELTGQVVLLDFWATWCGPCHAQAEILDELHAEFAAKGLAVVSIDTNEDLAKVKAFINANPAEYQVLVDEDGRVGDSYGVVALPTVVLVDRQGRVAFTSVGLTEASTLRPLIERELARADVRASRGDLAACKALLDVISFNPARARSIHRRKSFLEESVSR